jgi:hypothetical protein
LQICIVQDPTPGCTFGGSGIAERDYGWSAENLLTVGRMQGDSVSLEYDPLGQPVVRRGRAGQGVRVTLYDGGSILADLDSAGNRIAEYIYDQGTDRPYAMLTGSTTVTGAQYSGDQRQVLRRARTAQDLTPFPPFPPLGCLPLRRVRLDPWTTLLGPRSATYNGRLESISWETPTTSSVTYSTAQV